MLQIYRFLINIILILSPIIIIFRLIKGKEDLKRFKEKLCFFSINKDKGKLIWFHGASVGEIQSIVPLIEKIEKNKNIKKILITSNTLSSSKIVKKFKFKKVIHQFFPIDTNYHSNKFINYWKPSVAFFIDSEIWPNMIINLKKKNIPIIILNGRITKKTFERWKFFSNFSNFIFSKIDLCLSSSKVSKFYLNRLGVKNLKYFGNLKFSQSENDKLYKFNDLRKIISKRKAWCASSTHYDEEKFCGLVHKQLKQKNKNILTIIIPRHIERANRIVQDLNKLNLITHTSESSKPINKNTDVYIVNSYGKTKSIYNICKNVFLGGSLIEHGGQNPLEATRYGCKVLHGPNINNFREIYNYLSSLKLSHKISNKLQTVNMLEKLFTNKNNSRKIQVKLKKIGYNILKRSYKEINKFY